MMDDAYEQKKSQISKGDTTNKRSINGRAIR